MVKARVWDAIRHQKPSWTERLRAWGPRLAVPVAAVVAIAAYLGAPALHGLPQTGVEASYFLDEHNAAAQQNPFGPGIGPAIYTPDTQDVTSVSSAASYIDTADAATLDDADRCGPLASRSPALALIALSASAVLAATTPPRHRAAPLHARPARTSGACARPAPTRGR